MTTTVQSDAGAKAGIGIEGGIKTGSIKTGGTKMGGTKMGGKAEGAFRTISEVAEDLGVLPHVLRFWETKFPQIRPLKRAGGRRYYRPEDVALLQRIRRALHDEGYTIKGLQRRLQDGVVVEVVPSIEAAPVEGTDPEPKALAPHATASHLVAPAPVAPAPVAIDPPSSSSSTIGAQSELKLLLAELEAIRATLAA